MKKLLFIVTAMLLIGVTSCNKGDRKCKNLQNRQNELGLNYQTDSKEYEEVTAEMLKTGGVLSQMNIKN